MEAHTHTRDEPETPPNAALHAACVVNDAHDTGAFETHLLLTHAHCCPYVATSVLHAACVDATQYVLGWHLTIEPNQEQ